MAGARRFIYNIAQFPGCGAVSSPSSYVAFDLATGWLAGLVLVSFVGEETGHITQLCVTPAAREGDSAMNCCARRWLRCGSMARSESVRR